MTCESIDIPSITHGATFFLAWKGTDLESWNIIYSIFNAPLNNDCRRRALQVNCLCLFSSSSTATNKWIQHCFCISSGRMVETRWTTLSFTGKSCQSEAKGDERWNRFMENFQTEVLEIEFTEFSHGFKTISDLDFAELLLRYTDFDRETKKTILKKVKKTTNQPNVRRRALIPPCSSSPNLSSPRASHLNNSNTSSPFWTIWKNSVLRCAFINCRINRSHKVTSSSGKEPLATVSLFSSWISTSSEDFHWLRAGRKYHWTDLPYLRRWWWSTLVINSLFSDA